MEDFLKQHVGELIAFFVYSEVNHNGSNAVYTLERMIGARLMSSQLSGGEKEVWLQPVTIVDDGAYATENTPNSNGLIRHIMLAR